MPFVRRHRITTRVFVACAAVAVLLGTALAILLVAVAAQRDAGRAAFRSQEALTAASELDATLVTIENGLRGYVASGRQRFLEPANVALDRFPAQLDRLRRLARSDGGEGRAVERIGEEIDDYVGLWARPLIRLARARLPAARSVVLTRGGRERLDAIAGDLRRLQDRVLASAHDREHRAERWSRIAIATGVGGLIAVLAAAAAFAVYLRRTVVRPVLDLAAATSRVEDGDLSVRVPAERADEIGDLGRSFNAMTGSLEASRRELERSNAELEQFASVASHDLQAPLVTISMYVGLLERRDPADLAAEEELLAGIKGATSQARELIRDLLEFARAGRGTAQVEEVPAEQPLRQAIDSLRGPLAEAGARLTVGTLPVVCADRANLCRVFQNLVGNAVKFTDGRPPEIDISAGLDGGGMWRFRVRDNGIGMDPAHVERVFEPFQRIEDGNDFPGTGIGLSVCDRIIAQLGGRMGIESELGKGSTVWFTLPGAVTPVATEPDPAPPVGVAA